MPSSPPRLLYRYRKFDDTTLDSLCHDTLYFANPTTFNDPFDCKPELIADSPIEELRSLLADMVTRRVSSEISDSLTQARVEGNTVESYANDRGTCDANRVLADIAYNATNPDYECSREEAEKHLVMGTLQRELARNYDHGVCCFSTVWRNPLFWSHYGDQHRGMCVGYDLNRKPRPTPHKVIYGENRLIRTSTLFKALVHGNENARADLDRDVLLRKAPGWRYEREWRLFGKKGIQDSPLRLRSITFGLRCPISVMHTVVSALQTRDEPVDFFETYNIHGSYKLGRSEYGVGEELQVFHPKTAMSPEEAFGSSNDG